MNIKIITVSPAEVDIFWSLFSQILQSEFPGYTKKVLQFMLEKIYTRYAYTYWVSRGVKTILLAMIDNEPVGFAVIDEPYGGVSSCRWLGVKKEHQRRRVGSKLIEVWIEHAKTVGCHKAEVAAQPEARDFYQKVGLIEEGKRTRSYFGIDQYIFGKVIGEPSDEVMAK